MADFPVTKANTYIGRKTFHSDWSENLSFRLVGKLRHFFEKVRKTFHSDWSENLSFRLVDTKTYIRLFFPPYSVFLVRSSEVAGRWFYFSFR